MAKNQAQLAKERKAKAAKELAAKKKKMAQNRANANKPGYDKHGTKTVAQRNKEKAAAADKKKKDAANARVQERLKKEQQRKQVSKIKETISKPSTVDQTELRKKRAAEANKGGSVATQNKIKKERAKIAERNKLSKAFAGSGKAATKKLEQASKEASAKRASDKKAASDEAARVKKIEGSKYAKRFKRKGERIAKRGRAKNKKIARLKEKAEAAKHYGANKKAHRLAGRAQRKLERKQGTRKSALGTALKGAGLGLARGLARVGGYGGKFKKGMASQKKGYVKPNPSELKPISSNLRAQNKAVDKDKENK